MSKDYDIADPNDPNTLRVPFMFVPHGCEPTPEWLRAHPGAIKIPAVMVPRDPQPGESGPQWNVQLDLPNEPAAAPAVPAPAPAAQAGFAPVGRRAGWPVDRHGRPWPRSRFGQPMCPIHELPPSVRKPGEAPGPGQSYDVMPDAIAAWRAAGAVFANPGRADRIMQAAADWRAGRAGSEYGLLTKAQPVKPANGNRGLVEELVEPSAVAGDDGSDAGRGGNSAIQRVSSQTTSGEASYYDLPGNLMANGQPFDPNAMNAAMLGVPLGTIVTVSLADNPAKPITVRITDRGPYVAGRVIDLSPAAFVALVGALNVGVARVVVTVP